MCSNNEDAAAMLPILERTKARGFSVILLHIMDEYRGRGHQVMECVKIYFRFKLVLREYQFYGQNSSVPIIQIPLPYNNILRSPHDDNQHFHSVRVAEWSLKRNSSSRPYKWSFIGSIYEDNGNHKDRRKAVGNLISLYIFIDS